MACHREPLTGIVKMQNDPKVREGWLEWNSPIGLSLSLQPSKH